MTKLDKYLQIIQFLSTKKELFLEIEATMDLLSYGEVDEITACMEERNKIIEQVKAIDIKIKAVCEKDKMLLAALNNSCNKSEISPTLIEIYDASLGVKAVVNRIMNNDNMVTMHLEHLQKKVLKQIKQMNTSVYVVADKYHRSLEGVTKRNFSKKGKIV